MPYKRNQLRSMFFAAVLGLAVMMPVMMNNAYAATEPFNLGWLELLREEAVTKGVRPETVERLLPNSLQPLETVERQSQAQPEKRATLNEYLSARVTPLRIAKGRSLMNDSKNAKILNRVEHQYHIPPQLIMAIWAMETSYGSHRGDFNVIRALVTVARTKPEYRREVIEALKMVDEGYTEIETEPSSWAGAFGQTQFIPSSFRRLAVDGDGDGRADIWDNLADIFATTANHLQQSGWKEGESWGHKVVLPPGFNRDLLTDLKKERSAKSKTLEQWAQLGVRLPGGGALPLDYNKPVTIIVPDYNPQTDSEARGEAFVVYDNFWAILDYNSSYKYSLAVNKLADAIGRPQMLRQPE